MKNYIILVCLIVNLSSQTLFSQENKVSLAAYYPIALNGEHFREIYKSGLLGFEVDYKLTETGPVILEGVLSAAYMVGEVRIHGTDTPYDQSKTYFIQPGIQARLKGIPKFEPIAGLGLTVKTSSYDLRPGRPEEDFKTSYSDVGVNADLGFRWNWGLKLFFLLKYDYTRLFSVEETGDFERDLESLGMIQAGLGLRL